MTKVVVIGGTGLIGSKLVTELSQQGHEVVAGSPDSGVNTVTGEGLAAALSGARVVIDVSNSPSFEAAAVLDFFTRSTTNLLAAARAAGVDHYVALSVVGTQRLDESPYFRAKNAQEQLIEESGLAYTIVHATQFYEFVRSIADSATVDGVVHVPPVLIQPMAAADVASAVARVALGPPANGVVEIAGPEQFGLEDLITQRLTAQGDQRDVVADPGARYFGAHLQERTLVPDRGAQTAGTRFEDWLAHAN